MSSPLENWSFINIKCSMVHVSLSHFESIYTGYKGVPYNATNCSESYVFF